MSSHQSDSGGVTLRAAATDGPPRLSAPGWRVPPTTRAHTPTHPPTDSSPPGRVCPRAEWVTNTPLIILTLGLLAGVTYTEAFFTTVLSVITTAALFAAAVSTGYNAQWPIYAFGIVAALPVVFTVLFTWSARASSAPSATAKTFTALAWMQFLLAVGYAVQWGVAEGGRVESADQEVIVYAVLDIISRVVFGFILLFVPNAVSERMGVWWWWAGGFLHTQHPIDLLLPASMLCRWRAPLASSPPLRRASLPSPRLPLPPPPRPYKRPRAAAGPPRRAGAVVGGTPICDGTGWGVCACVKCCGIALREGHPQRRDRPRQQKREDSKTTNIKRHWLP